MQLHDVAVKKQSDEKRRAERKQRHLQDDLRYALKKVPELHDASLSYDEVSYMLCSRDVGVLSAVAVGPPLHARAS